jgi:hypothetical protein
MVILPSCVPVKTHELKRLGDLLRYHEPFAGKAFDDIADLLIVLVERTPLY